MTRQATHYLSFKVKFYQRSGETNTAVLFGTVQTFVYNSICEA